MENVTRDPRAVRRVVASGALADDPFVPLDVGCALGIDPASRHFDRYLVAHGFDPQVDECARLNAAETNPNIVYHPHSWGLSCEAAIRSADILGFLSNHLHRRRERRREHLSQHRPVCEEPGILALRDDSEHVLARCPPKDVRLCSPVSDARRPADLGDMLYVRDAGSPDHETVWQSPLRIQSC
jgi:hypothetical protein